jgi:hypothetical protein
MDGIPNISLICEDTRHLLTASTPTIPRTRPLILPAQNIDPIEGFLIKSVWQYYCNIFTTSLYTWKSCIPVTNMYTCIRHNLGKFGVHVTVHRVKFLRIKLTWCINFSILFLEWNSVCFEQFLCPSSGVFHYTHSNGICHKAESEWNCSSIVILLASCQQTCLPYTMAVCTGKNS